MCGTHNLIIFIISGLLLNITPGADSLYIVNRSISQGLRAGVVAALGISTGCSIHIFFAALGLSALLATYALAFNIVKIIGATYLAYIGFSLLRTKVSLAPSNKLPAQPIRTIYFQGILTNTLNPKVALFFLALLPQFIEQNASHKTAAFIFLGAIFNFTGTLWCLFLAWASASIRAHGINGHVASWLNRSIGSLFVLLGLSLALEKQD